MASTVGRSISLTTLVCLVVVWVNPSLASQCQQPEWQESLGPNPMTSRRGKVVVVALLKAYCGLCIQQAQRLESMKAALLQGGYPDVDVIVVNGGDRQSRRLAANLVNATSLVVLQDRSDHVMYRQIFRGNKDDFLVYDRCGQAAVYIPYPYSSLAYTITELMVQMVHSGQHMCYCSLDYPDQASGNTSDDDVMAGDDPSAYNLSPSRSMELGMGSVGESWGGSTSRGLRWRGPRSWISRRRGSIGGPWWRELFERRHAIIRELRRRGSGRGSRMASRGTGFSESRRRA